MISNRHIVKPYLSGDSRLVLESKWMSGYEKLSRNYATIAFFVHMKRYMPSPRAKGDLKRGNYRCKLEMVPVFFPTAGSGRAILVVALPLASSESQVEKYTITKKYQ
jgi:hypothetical protein